MDQGTRGKEVHGYKSWDPSAKTYAPSSRVYKVKTNGTLVLRTTKAEGEGSSSDWGDLVEEGG